jgi:hypothetical protein
MGRIGGSVGRIIISKPLVAADAWFQASALSGAVFSIGSLLQLLNIIATKAIIGIIVFIFFDLMID